MVLFIIVVARDNACRVLRGNHPAICVVAGIRTQVGIDCAAGWRGGNAHVLARQVLHNGDRTVQHIIIGARDDACRIGGGNDVAICIVGGVTAHVLIGLGRVVAGKVGVGFSVAHPRQVADDGDGAIGSIVIGARHNLVLVNGGNQISSVVIHIIVTDILTMDPTRRRCIDINGLPGQVFNGGNNTTCRIKIAAGDLACRVFRSNLITTHIVEIRCSDVIKIILIFSFGWVVVAPCLD